MKAAIVLTLMIVVATSASAGQLEPDSSNPVYLQDRGTGVATSMFGTYIRKNALIVYPFYECYRDHDLEYKPGELGAPGEVDYRGEYRAHEGRRRARGISASTRWNISSGSRGPAERAVALLLLKGLSLKEVAAIRTTTERTIRAQARSIYSKAGLTGRAALSAFFLEDLLAPIDEAKRALSP